MKIQAFVILLPLLFTLSLWSATPVPYSGKIDIRGVNYYGEAQFAFSLHDENGSTHWRNGNQPGETIKITIRNGRYNVLLGGQGMNSLPPELFLNHDKLYLKVEVDMGDGEGLRHLAPDQLITSTPRALVAELAKVAEIAKVAEKVGNGAITRDMLSSEVLSQLDANGSSSTIGPITRDMLPTSVLNDLNKTIVITREMLPQDVRNDLNRTLIITRHMLPADLLADLNHSISAGSISLDMLAPEVLNDLNRTISKNNLGSDVLSDLNSSISLNRLSPEVLAALQVTPSISTEPFARYDWRTDSATIEARGRGHNLSYQWLKNGQVISGANAPVLELSNPVLDDNATYSVQLTNSVGQTTSQTITLQQAIGAPGLPLEEANATQVPRNGLVLWLDANDIDADGNEDSLVVGDRVASWTDKISKNKAEQDDLNKEPIREISGIGFSLNDSLVLGDLNTSAKHIFIVGKRKYRQGWSSLINGKDINQVRWYHSMSDISGDGGTTEFTYGTGGSRRISGGFTSLPLDETFIVTLTKGNHLLDGGLFADLTIGSGLDGEISEILFYDRFLQNNERDAVERYLADKWGIQLHADKLAAEQAAYEAALPPDEPENGLQAYYKFEPISVEPTKLWDYSGNGKHIEMSGFSPTPWGDGIEGKALSFDGINDKAHLNGFNVSLLTIAFWAKPYQVVDGRDSENSVFRGHGGGKPEKSFAFNKARNGGSGHWIISSPNNNNTYSAVETATTHTSIFHGWFHVALVATATSADATFDFYANGQKINTTSTSSLPGLFPEYSFVIGQGLGENYYSGFLDDFRVYDRTFSPAEVEGLYLSYQNPIIRTSGEHNATVGTNFSLSLAADNEPTTYLAEGLPAGLSLNTTTGQISGSLSQPGYHRVFVKAMNEHGTGSDTIAIVARPQTDQYGWPVDVPDGSDIPQNGLVLWLDANDVDADGEFDTSTDHLKLSNWADKAGKDHNATQATAAKQPEIRSGQISGKPNLKVALFEGGNKSLNFDRITQIRTFFWVVSRSSGNSESAIFYDTETNWISMSYGTTIWKDNTSSIITDGQNRLNGSAFSGNGTFPTDLGIISTVTTDFAKAQALGKRTANNNFFYGRIGEILVYDRALSTNEIETVEKYLGKKWGISISHSTTPSPSGNPPTFTVTPANDTVTTAHLTDQILKYLKPEITSQPQAQTVYADTNASFSVTAEGKYLTYQWKKDGSNLTGETNATLTITDANATLHDGNYTVVVSNDFGSVTSAPTLLQVNTTFTVDLNATVAMDMLWVPPGTFTMGSPTTEVGRQADREDEHNVTLTKGFYLGKYEVTQAQYMAVIGTNPSEFNATGNGNRPVEKVNWTEAVAFCTQLTTQEQAAGRLPAGWAYVLPSESQWEYACRAGTTTAHSWGATIASSNANYNWDGAWNTGSDFKQTRDVGQYTANPWGFFDMHGNVWEWTADWYQAAYPTGNPVVDPSGPASGSNRVFRGGSWTNGGTHLRPAKRHDYNPSTPNNNIGFRVGFQKQ